MGSITATAARKNLYNLISSVNENCAPIAITNSRGKGGVLIGEDEWAAIEETLYLTGIPGMAESIVAGTIGLFVAWPLAITAGVGAFNQNKLPDEVFQVIENTIMTGGSAVVVTGAGLTVTAGMVVCPNCKAQVPADAKFCDHCGTKLIRKCPKCGAPVNLDGAFCFECGEKL